MNKYIEELKLNVATYPTISGSVSSSALYSTRKHQSGIATAIIHKLPDAKGEGVVSMTIYESTASTWNGAVATAITASVVTASLTSVSNVTLEYELRNIQMSCNGSSTINGKDYIGLYITMPSSSGMCATIQQGKNSYVE